jgi:hypothetical protein
VNRPHFIVLHDIEDTSIAVYVNVNAIEQIQRYQTGSVLLMHAGGDLFVVEPPSIVMDMIHMLD